MSDRFRVGEILAGIGTVLLSMLMLFGQWVGATLAFDHPGLVYGGSPGINAMLSHANIHASGGVQYLGWFVVLVLAAAALSGLVFLARVATAKSTERPMLQGPIAFSFALLALIVILIDTLLFTPSLNAGLTPLQQTALQLGHLKLSGSLTTTGWLGVLCLVLMTVGSWIAFSDERTDTAAAKARTEALLRGVVTRPAPPADTPTPVVPDPAEGLDAEPNPPTAPSDGGTA